MIQKLDEMHTVFRFHFDPTDTVLEPVEASKHMLLMFETRPSSWNTFLLSGFHPASSQWYIQRQGGFVYKDELEIISEDHFELLQQFGRFCQGIFVLQMAQIVFRMPISISFALHQSSLSALTRARI